MGYRNRLEKIIAGEEKLSEEQKLRMDHMPKEIPPLPKGEEALKPHTKAGWETEAVIRAMLSNLHNGRDWKTLYIYGGSGKVARDWKSFFETIELLKTLEPNETLFLQSGVSYGKMQTTRWAPRVVITNSVIVPHWTPYFQEMVDAGLTVYGQMTAGSFIFIGLQGIIQGTYETIAAAIKSAQSKEAYEKLSDFEKQLFISSGLGLMSGAQPLAAKMCNRVSIIAEINPKLVDRMYNEGRDQGAPYLDIKTDDIEEAVNIAREYAERNEAVSIGVCCNAVDLLQYLVDHNITPHLLTDQTSAHDLLNGYYPQNMTCEEADQLRKTDPDEYLRRSKETVKRHVKLMIELHKRGAETFDYGNNIRQQAYELGVEEAFNFPGFVVAYVRPLFCVGKGPFRWAALSNDPEDIRVTDEYAKKLFYDDPQLVNWINLASKYIPFEKGLPARVFWAGFIGRAAFGMLMNKLVAEGKLKAPVIIGRDHLDGGSVASPNRETEGMKDGSDAIGDYPVLNLLGNALTGATWVSYHGGGGVGVGYSLHAGQVIVADGTRLAQEKLFRVLTWDPLSAILRHAAAGYEEALEIAEKEGIVLPGKNDIKEFDYEKLYDKIISLVEERTGVKLFEPMKEYSMKLL
ncbi:MAG: urocanate hydratase [Candidatus Heimdallarchaeum aukensis]|uniref:Urocanate hydratase n=1 Tax=Candidatus Heimdallarchaeum aukensis TaxID=2876573 RepID=A0A9Y1FK03_9ARCH|nr:MAG: urocanate hydratase [Candidatus Heimdallarchaeum aukensis]